MIKTFTKNLIYLFFLAICFCVSQVYADVKLPQLVSDGMILQRDTKLKIWGWASPGEKVSVAFNGKKGSATTGADSKWLIEF